MNNAHFNSDGRLVASASPSCAFLLFPPLFFSVFSSVSSFLLSSYPPLFASFSCRSFLSSFLSHLLSSHLSPLLPFIISHNSPDRHRECGQQLPLIFPSVLYDEWTQQPCPCPPNKSWVERHL